MHNDIAVKIIDCFTYKQKSGARDNAKRDFCALAFRSDTAGRYVYYGKTLTAPCGAVVFVPSGIEYSTSSKRGKIYAIHFKIMNYSYRDIEILDMKNSEYLRNMFIKAIDVWEKKERGYRYKATSIFYEILSTLDRVGENQEGGLASEAREYISTHFSDSELTIKEVAEKMYVSEAYLRKKFHEVYNTSPKEYLTKRRIEFAKYLIETNYFSQSEMAERCGFSSVKYFRTAFKAKCKITVSEYKKLH